MNTVVKFQKIVSACHNAKDPHCVAADSENNYYTGPSGSGGSQALCADCVKKVEDMLKEGDTYVPEHKRCLPSKAF